MTSKSMSSHAIQGMAFASVAMVLTKIFSFSSQYVLGKKLDDSDFKLYGLAIGLEIYVAAFRHSWVSKLLIQRGKEVDQLSMPFAWIGLFSNCIAALLLILITYTLKTTDALWDTGLYVPGLLELIYWVAASYILSTFPDIYITRLKTQLEFKKLEIIRASSFMMLHASMIVFVLMGYGPLSFVMPLIVFATYQWIVCRWVHGPIPKGRPIDLTLIREIAKPVGMLMVGSMLVALTLYGDYNVVGMAAPYLLGTYYFGFKLVGAFLSVFTDGVNSIMLPMFAKISDEQHRQQSGFKTALNLLVFATAPISMGAYLIGFPLVNLIWGGKWDFAAEVVQYIGLSLVFQSVMPLAMALFESKGAWKLRLAMLSCDGVGFVLAAFIGSLIGTLPAIAGGVLVHRLIMSMIYLFFSCKLIDLKFSHVYPNLAKTLLLNLIAGTLAYYGANYISSEQTFMHSRSLLDLIRAVAFCIIWTALMGLFMKSTVLQLISIVRPKR